MTFLRTAACTGALEGRSRSTIEPAAHGGHRTVVAG